MDILLLEPFFVGSHKAWAEGLQKHSTHNIQILSLPGRHWKWRMHGAAISLARKFLEGAFLPDLILATDMLDLSTFLSLTRERTANIPTAIYFHENQLSYPWSPTDADVDKGREKHYGFINYTSALSADKVFFNSEYHRISFLEALETLLRRMPDHKEVENVERIRAKSEVLHLALELDEVLKRTARSGPPLILWNHRWEYDKGPEEFFELMFSLKAEGLEFELAVLGASYKKVPAIFERAKKELADRIIASGFVERAEYKAILNRADVLPVTSIQDFFGGSVVEAIHHGAHPLLPNRLAYPEHIPAERRSEFLYKDGEELYTKLKALLQDVECLRNAEVPSMSHYAFSEASKVYDEMLSAT